MMYRIKLVWGFHISYSRKIEEGHSGQGGIEDQPKQFERELFLQIFTENVGFSGFFRFFRFVSVCYETVLFVSVVSI